jgi:hypothetical protein
VPRGLEQRDTSGGGASVGVAAGVDPSGSGLNPRDAKLGRPPVGEPHGVQAGGEEVRDPPGVAPRCVRLQRFVATRDTTD